MVTKATTLSYVILRSFQSNHNSASIKAYKSYVRPLLEYNSVVWNVNTLRDIRCIERVQRTFTRILLQRSNTKYNSYFDRLEILGLESLELRRLQFDLITVYKIFHNFIDLTIDQFFTPIQTAYNLRHHLIALRKPTTAKTNVLQNCFKFRVIGAWNSLPNTLVINKSLIVFKSKLHQFSLQRFLSEHS